MQRQKLNLVGIGSIGTGTAAWILAVIGLGGVPDDIAAWIIIFETMYQDPWVTVPYFIGVVILVLTNIPKSRFWMNQAAANNANFVVLPQLYEHSLIWDPPLNLQIISTPKMVMAPGVSIPLGNRAPTLQIKNIGNAVAEDISILFETTMPEPIEKIFMSSPRVKKYSPNLKDGMMNIEVSTGDNTNGWGVSYAQSNTTHMKFIAHTIDNEKYIVIHMPHDIWSAVELFVVASMPDQAYSTVKTNILVTISWVKPFRNSQNFTVEVTARNMKPYGTGRVQIPMDGIMRDPPIVMSSIKFSVA